MNGDLPLRFLTWAVDRPVSRLSEDPEAEGHNRILVVAGVGETRAWIAQGVTADSRTEVIVASDAAMALSMLQTRPCAVVVADFSGAAGGAVSPGDAEGFVSQVKALDVTSEVIAISDRGAPALSLDLMRDGAFDCLMAPASPQEICSAVGRALRHRRLTLEERAYYELIERTVYRRERDMHTIFFELQESYRQTLWALGSALESRDVETNAHSIRVMNYSHAMGQALGITGKTLEDVEYGVFLHDIGKIAVPDSILLKPDKLTEDEWVTMREHPGRGRYLLAGIDFLKGGIDIVYCHHERWDGQGYPRKLKGEAIPFGARIFAIADTLDAMTSDRPYRKAMPYDRARAEILANSGSQFDPVVVNTFRGFTDAQWQKIREESEDQARAIVRRKQENLKD
jgi:response regulator RpfG family c-di-GMP phosphodiesterase